MAAALDEWERPTFGAPATAEAIAAFRVAAGFSLPAGLEALLSEHESIRAMGVHNGYWIGGIEQLAAALARAELPRTARDEPVVPVATDGGGNAFLVSSRGHVWRWEHETGTTTEIATSVEAFLERVAADWEAFVAGTPGWRFLV